MDAALTKLLECSKKQQKDFNKEILPILERIFKLPSEEQKDFVKKAFSVEVFKEINKLDFYDILLLSLKIQAALSNLDPQLTVEFFKNNLQIEDDRGKSITVSKTTEMKYPQVEDDSGKIITVSKITTTKTTEETKFL